jgi:hypothetical protein
METLCLQKGQLLKEFARKEGLPVREGSRRVDEAIKERLKIMWWLRVVSQMV